MGVPVLINAGWYYAKGIVMAWRRSDRDFRRGQGAGAP